MVIKFILQYLVVTTAEMSAHAMNPETNLFTGLHSVFITVPRILCNVAMLHVTN